MAKAATRRERASSAMEQLADEFGQLVMVHADRVRTTLIGAGQQEDASIAAALVEGLKVQVATLSSGVRDVVGMLNNEQRQLLDAQTMGSGGPALVRAGMSTVERTPAALAGIVELIEPIKKILRLLLDLLGKFITIPSFINTILDFIDNILRVLSGMMGSDAGKRAERAQNTMYRHLREIYRTEAASLSRLGRRAGTEEESSE